MFILKRKHDLIVKEKDNRIEHLEKSVAEAQNLKFVFEVLADKTKDTLSWVDGVSMNFNGSTINLPDNVPVYVEDHFGGKVIKQESTPVTILDENGKATYAVTAKKPEKGKKYILVLN